MKCSIVLTTCYRYELLNLTLESIFKQNPPFDTEVIVVNDGQSDDVFNVCKKYEGRIYYHFTNNKAYRNPSAARNVGYLATRGEVIISQCDDVVHVSDNVVENLVDNLKPGTFLLAKCENWDYVCGKPVKYVMDYCSLNKRPVPFFFCGAVRREDLYAVGGNDEDFVEVCFDDNWFADCLTKGLGLKPEYSTDILTHHIHHGYPKDSHRNESTSKKLYMSKVAEAKQTGIWQASSGPWPLKKEVIPKCMNFFWSSNKMSWLRYLTLKSFRSLHPDWKMRLFSCDTNNKVTWSSGESHDMSFNVSDNYYSAINDLDVEIVQWEPCIQNLSPAHASDVLEWEVLSTDGGFYSDMDILYLKPIDYDSICNNDVVYCNSRGYMTIGFFGATPNNVFFNSVLGEALRGYTGRTYQDTGAEAIYRLASTDFSKGRTKSGDLAMVKLIRRFRQLRYRQLSDATVYPFAWNEQARVWVNKETVPEETIGIHWFGGAKQSQEINCKLTPDNLSQFPCTFTSYAKRYI